MGKYDAETKKYMSDSRRFADAFNYLIYDGEPVIDPDKLTEADTTQVVLPYGNDAKEVLQKYRDILKIWGAKQDDKAVYVILGIEDQTSIHYAMPVRDMLYDAIHYAKQVDEAGRSYRRNGTGGDSLTSGEFLSGFRKTDRLMPVITLVVHFGSKKWDAPTSIHEMIATDDKQLLKFVPDYKINLIAPAQMEDTEFDKFRTGLGLALKYIKHSENREELKALANDKRFRHIDYESASIANLVTNSELALNMDEEGNADMCQGILDLKEEGRQEGRQEGVDETRLESIQNIMETLKLTAQQAMEALRIPDGDRPKYAARL